MALWKLINVGNALLIARWRCIRFATFIHVDADGVAVYRIHISHPRYGAIQVLRNARGVGGGAGWGGGRGGGVVGVGGGGGGGGGGDPALRSVTGGGRGVLVLVLRNACIYFTR